MGAFSTSLLLLSVSFLLCSCEAEDVHYSGAGMNDRIKFDQLKRFTRQFSSTINSTQKDFHEYYNSTFFGPGTPTAQELWLDLSSLSSQSDLEIVQESSLSQGFRVFATHLLNFDFQFYGHTINQVSITTAGFLYTSDFLHSAIHLTQYIAPLQADFNPGISPSGRILTYSTTNRFTVQWDRVRLNSNVFTGEFTFQVSLFPNGTIHFAYRDIPANVSTLIASSSRNHPVEVGLADAFYFDQQIAPDLILRRVFEYNRIQLNQNLLNFSAFIIDPIPGCVAADSCESCVAATEATTFTCGWCNTLSRCSDGFDRFRQDWFNSGCNDQSTTSCPPPSALSAGPVAGIAVSVLLVVVLLLLIICVGVGILVYGYKHPTSPLGLFMIEHRPKARTLNKKSASYEVGSGKTILGEA